MTDGYLLVAGGFLLAACQTALPFRSARPAAASLAAALVLGGLLAAAFPRHALEAAVSGIILLALASGWTSACLNGIASDFGRLGTAASALVGMQAIVVETIDAFSHEGAVEVGGEVWRARSVRGIERGQPVVVDRIEGTWAIVHPGA